MFLWPFTFTAEIKVQTLLLRHIHFPVQQRENQACTVDHFMHDSVNLLPTPVVSSVRC